MLHKNKQYKMLFYEYQACLLQIHLDNIVQTVNSIN